MPKSPFPLCLALLLTLAVPALTHAQTCPPTPACFVALGDADRTTFLNPDAIVAVEILDADHLRVDLQGGHDVHLAASPTTFWPALAQGCGDEAQPQGFLGDLVWDAAQRVASNPGFSRPGGGVGGGESNGVYGGVVGLWGVCGSGGGRGGSEAAGAGIEEFG